MDQQAEPGGAVRRDVLDELVVSGSPAEPRRECLLEHPDDVRVEERHPPRRELLLAPDGAKVGRPADRLQGAAAPSLPHLRLVAERHVQEREGPRPTDRRDEEPRGGQGALGGLRLDDGQPITQDVYVVGGVPVEAALADRAGLGARVGGARLGADGVHGGQPGDGQGLPGDRELHPGEVDSRGPGRLAQANGRAHQGVEVGRQPGPSRRRDPVEDRRRLLEGRRSRAKRAEAGRGPRPAQDPLAPAVAGVEPRGRGGDQGEPAGGAGAGEGEPQDRDQGLPAGRAPRRVAPAEPAPGRQDHE
jgi:hypothetical protein